LSTNGFMHAVGTPGMMFLAAVLLLLLLLLL
jgi:hypothetical protein